MFDYKTATEDELKTEFLRIAKESGSDTMGTRKEFFCLPEILMDDEEVLALSSGFMDGNTWLISLTDRRVIFLDKGLIFGLKQVSIDLDQVNAVSGSTGMMFGKIIIQDGATSHVIENVLKASVNNFTSKVQAAMAQRKAARYVPPQPAIAQTPTHHSGDDFIAQLEKLGGLMEKGLLSREEFELAKKKLLSM